jgi:hypothetical protein
MDRPNDHAGLSHQKTSNAIRTRLLRRLMVIAWRHGMTGQAPGQGGPLIPQPSQTLPALRQAVAAVAPGRLPEMFTKMQEAFVRAGEEGSVTPIHMFYREWAVIVEIERHPDVARRLHTAEQALMSDDPQVRDAAIREAGEIVRAAHQTVAGE